MGHSKADRNKSEGSGEIIPDELLHLKGELYVTKKIGMPGDEIQILVET